MSVSRYRCPLDLCPLLLLQTGPRSRNRHYPTRCLFLDFGALWTCVHFLVPTVSLTAVDNKKNEQLKNNIYIYIKKSYICIYLYIYVWERERERHTYRIGNKSAGTNQTPVVLAGLFCEVLSSWVNIIVWSKDMLFDICSVCYWLGSFVEPLSTMWLPVELQE